MNQRRLISFLTAMLLGLSALVSAHAETTLSSVTDAMVTLLTNTPNVTITGKAEFRRDGERFKTAEITYIQDDDSSFWQEKLLTPREQQPDRETGFTVIANQESIYVMEPFTPGAYRKGYSAAQNAILRDSLEGRLLLSTLKAAAKLAEPALSSAVSVTENGLVISLTDKNIPEFANNILLTSARFAAKRLFGINFDENVTDRTDWYLTDAKEMMYMTESCRIRSTNIQISLDTEGRPASLSGQATVGLTYLNGEQHELDTDFDLTFAHYGDSEVKPFDPEAYGVIPWREALRRNEEAERQAIEQILPRAFEALQASGCPVTDRLELTSGVLKDGVFTLRFTDPKALLPWEDYSLEITDTGHVLRLSTAPWQRYEDWNEHEQPVTAEWTDEHAARVAAFLKQVNPELEYDELVPVSEYAFDDTLYLELEGGPAALFLTVRLTPEWQIEYYTCIGNG